MKFFKSMRRQYAEQFFADGKLRVGTLYDFRRVEDYGDETGDAGEGTKRLYSDQRHVTESTIPAFLQRKIRVGAGNRLDIVIDGDGELAADVQDPDLYIFCVSMDFDRERMRRLGHDACVVIEDTSFFQHLHNAMKPYIAPESKGVLRDVIYGSRRHFHTQDPGLQMAVVKPERFAYQKEARALWLPHPGLPIEPFRYVHASLAISSCRKVVLDDTD